jgi:protein-L-isoaspartate O-methyltransferase
MAEVVGPTGQVIGIEIDSGLAARASQNLTYLKHVRLCTAMAGSTSQGRLTQYLSTQALHIRGARGLDSLQLGGRLIIPLYD